VQVNAGFVEDANNGTNPQGPETRSWDLQQNMVTLAQVNPYLRDPVKRRRMLTENARQSSIFEGARIAFARPAVHARTSNAAPRASLKKAVNGA
jgi:hypothetical protein